MGHSKGEADMMKISDLTKAAMVLLLVLAGHALGDAASLNQKLAESSRTDADKARDAGRRPAEVLEFLGLKPGMTAFDMIAAGGYYTEVLSVAVGEEGRVYAQNPERVLKFRDGANDKALTARLADGRVPNVVRLDRPMDDLGIELGSVDLVITALNLHDVYNNSPQAAVGMLQLAGRLLKPGGVIGVIDHAGDADQDNSALHRMQLSQAVEAAEAAGFQVEQSSILANPDDDHTQMVFAPGVRGKTDRFVLKLTVVD
jgi:predicted methyltransferase